MMAGTVRKRTRWVDADSNQECDNCGYSLDECKCVCPFCGETSLCECTIGPDAAGG